MPTISNDHLPPDLGAGLLTPQLPPTPPSTTPTSPGDPDLPAPPVKTVDKRSPPRLPLLQLQGIKRPRAEGDPAAAAGAAPGGAPIAKKRRMVMTLPLPKLRLDVSLSQPASKTPAARLPADLAGKSLKLLDERLGNGSNGIVGGLLVDGKPSDAYVVKTVLLENYRHAAQALEGLHAEIALNRKLAAIAASHPLPNIVIGSGVKEIDNKLCLIMPRIHGGTLREKIESLYDQAVAGELEQQAFIDRLRDLVRGPMEGLAALHRHEIAMNDLNGGNFLYDKRGDRGVVIDFGLAGTLGEHKKPGTVGTMPPERMRSSDEPPTHESPDCSPLTDKTDAYAFGAVLYSFVHRDYPAWYAVDPKATQDQRLLEMGLSVDEFRRRGSLFTSPDGPLSMQLHASGRRESELALRSALRDCGFYEVIEQLTRPDPAARTTLAQALNESRFFNP